LKQHKKPEASMPSSGSSTEPTHDDTTLPTLADAIAGRSLETLVELGETPVGTGVFASRHLPGDEILCEIAGEIFDDYPDDPNYCMGLPSGKLLEPAAPLRFLNHSCDPNCELFYWEDEETREQEDRLWLQTIRPIAPGEQLLIDYCWPAETAIRCRCGATTCRGWIVDPDEYHLLPVETGDAGASSLSS
jgi:hypothetical protein